MLPKHSTATGSSGSACCPCTVQLPVAVAVLCLGSITLAGFFGYDCNFLGANFEKLARGFIHAVRTFFLGEGVFPFRGTVRGWGGGGGEQDV